MPWGEGEWKKPAILAPRKLRLSKASLGYTVRPTMNLILVTLLYLLILLYLTAPHIFISPGYISKGQASIL